MTAGVADHGARRAAALEARLRDVLAGWEELATSLGTGPTAAAVRLCARDVRRDVLLERSVPGHAARGGSR